DDLALVGRNRPAFCRFVEMRALDRRIELDVLAQVEPVGDIMHPPLDFRLAGEFFAPAPALVQIFGKQILVNIAFRIEACAGISVPIPGSADVRRSVERLHRQSLAAQKMQLVEARDAGADHGPSSFRGESELPIVFSTVAVTAIVSSPFGSGGDCRAGRGFGPALAIVMNHGWNAGVLNGN